MIKWLTEVKERAISVLNSKQIRKIEKKNIFKVCIISKPRSADCCVIRQLDIKLKRPDQQREETVSAQEGQMPACGSYNFLIARL